MRERAWYEHGRTESILYPVEMLLLLSFFFFHDGFWKGMALYAMAWVAAFTGNKATEPSACGRPLMRQAVHPHLGGM